ncbi:MAG: rubredoxin [Methanobrevibacter sp.]|jgi:rubredoxin|nr:rubredoxin [Methanobrevibacter sp.]
MTKTKCKICGYIYDPERGEKRRGIAVGTEWKDVPDDFRCPSCGAKRKVFIEID